VAINLGVENLFGLIERADWFPINIPDNRKFGETYKGSRFLKAEIPNLNCEIIACGTPEGESISGLGGLWPDDKGKLSLKLPRFITGPAARDNLEFLGYQMSCASVEHLGMPDPNTSAIIDFYREGPWTEIQRHLWDLSGGRIEIPTDKVTICHEEADNFLNRTAMVFNGEKLFYGVDPKMIKTLYLGDSVASGAQMAVALDYLINIKGCKPEKIVLMAPMLTLFGTVCLAKLLSAKGVRLAAYTGASILDINYGDEPEPGNLYYSPYPTSSSQLANYEFRGIYNRFHPGGDTRDGIRCNWTESFLLSSRAIMDSATELGKRGLTNVSLSQSMGRVTKELLVDYGLDFRKLYSYAARIEMDR
jgi:hypothetical protein